MYKDALDPSFFKNNKQLLFSLLIAIYGVELARTAWLSDDVGFTLRSVLNFINGYGPNFNIGERAQAFTHPLWFLLISLFTLIFKNVFITTFFLSISCSLLSMWFFLSRLSITIYGGIIGASILIFSNAFVDYSSSGLENPLTNLVLCFVIYYGYLVVIEGKKNYLVHFFITCSFLYLCRADALILVFPLAIYVCFRERKNWKFLFSAILLGATPVILWTLFSVLYYGFPFPLTAYAKLGAGIPLSERVLQGLIYLEDSFSRDPITLVGVAAAIISGLKHNPLFKAISFGLLLYLIYIVSIGGDFMSGRFFASPLFLGALIFGGISWRFDRFLFSIIGVLVLGSIGSFYSFQDSFKKNENNEPLLIYKTGIANERGFWSRLGVQETLQQVTRSSYLIPEWRIDKSNNAEITPVISECSVGIWSIFAGPKTHFMVTCGLADPFLATLPASYTKDWRIGHYVRQVPIGYKQSIESNSNQIRDAVLGLHYNSIHLITHGNLLSKDRLYEIFKVNIEGSKYLFRAFLESGIHFNQLQWSPFIKQIIGIGGWEPWGRWTDGKSSSVAKIIFFDDLPKKFTLDIVLSAFGSNVGAQTLIKIGNEKRAVVIQEGQNQFSIPFDLKSSANSIEIIPAHSTPINAVIPNSTDLRVVGVGLISLKLSNF